MKRQADKLWSLLVRRKGFCEACGDKFRLQAAHGFSRRYVGTRWLLINGFCLCSGCHVGYTYNPIAWDNYLRREWGPEVYDELRVQAEKITKLDMQAVLDQLKDEEGRS